jgi:hypothetical protein
LYNSLQKILPEDCHHSFMRPFVQMSLRAVRWRSNLTLSKLALFKKFCPLPGDCFVAPLALLAMTFLATACLPVNLAPPTQTPSPTETVAPTETIVWFPPSATATQAFVPTYTGTPEMNPGVGRTILEDDFSDEEVWDIATSDSGSAAIHRNRLTLAVQPGYYLASMRREFPLSDFYAEITARPSLCRGEDNYGLVVRGVGSSFYRFVLACNGQIRAERITGGTRLPLQEPVPSGDAPGAPGEVRMGIWAVGNEMRLFLNERYQFTVVDPSFPTGALGFFVRSTGETPVTVTFSDLAVYEVDYIPPTKTPIPSP